MCHARADVEDTDEEVVLLLLDHLLHLGRGGEHRADPPVLGGKVKSIPMRDFYPANFFQGKFDLGKPQKKVIFLVAWPLRPLPRALMAGNGF